MDEKKNRAGRTRRHACAGPLVFTVGLKWQLSEKNVDILKHHVISHMIKHVISNLFEPATKHKLVLWPLPPASRLRSCHRPSARRVTICPQRAVRDYRAGVRGARADKGEGTPQQQRIAWAHSSSTAQAGWPIESTRHHLLPPEMLAEIKKSIPM